MVLIVLSANSQTKILKVDPTNGSFKNFARVPSYEPFMIEGEVQEEIEQVEVMLNESKSNKTSTYFWNRTMIDKSSNFSVIITEGLQGSSTYDFRITTFKSLSKEDKQTLLKSLMQKVYAYLDAQLIIDKNKLLIENPNATFNTLNEIVVEGMSLQRSRNGIEVKQLSDLVRDEIKKTSKTKLKDLFGKRKDTKLELTENGRIKKLEYLVTLVYDEVLSFYESELVQLHRRYTIEKVKTEKDKFTLPINAGLYTFTTSPAFSGINASNSGLRLGVGFTIPIIRNYSVKGKKMPSLGLSFGVLTSPIKDQAGAKFSTPGVNIPVYGALGFGFFRVLRLNLGVAAVAPHRVKTVKSIYWYPTVGLTFELEGWLGIKR